MPSARPKCSFRLCRFAFCTTNPPTISPPSLAEIKTKQNPDALLRKHGLMRVKLKQSDLQLTRATACVGASHAEARTTAKGSSGVSKQPSHPPLVPFFSSACRLRLPTPSKAGYFSKHPQSQTVFFSFKQTAEVYLFVFFFPCRQDVGPR